MAICGLNNSTNVMASSDASSNFRKSGEEDPAPGTLEGGEEKLLSQARSGVARLSGQLEGQPDKWPAVRGIGEAQLLLERTEVPQEEQGKKAHNCSWPEGMRRNCLMHLICE